MRTIQTMTQRFVAITLFIFLCASIQADTYKYMGKVKEFTNKYCTAVDTYDQYYLQYIYDCYTTNGKNYATLVKCQSPNPQGDATHAIPKTIQYNGQTYTVEAIADEAFLMQDYVYKVTIPTTVKGIGYNAFESCGNLAVVNIGEGVQIIGERAFQLCHSLSRVRIGSNVHTIEDGAFWRCISLEHITLPKTLVKIGKDVFGGECGLKSVYCEFEPYVLTNWSMSFNDIFSSLFCDYDPVVFTNSTEIAAEARKRFSRVYCPEDVEKTEQDLAKAQKSTDYYNGSRDLYFNEDQNLQTYYKNLQNADVNLDGQLNSADVVMVYNKIIDGQTNSHNNHEYVDLGLPSGTLWATCNLGATTPEQVGDYFAWGENILVSYKVSGIFNKFEFTKNSYLPGVTISFGDLPVDKSPLAILYRWGGKWNLPTGDQANELYSNCTTNIVTVNGVRCVELTSKMNGNKIIFPCGGYIDGTKPTDKTVPYYWTSTTVGEDDAFVMQFTSNYSYKAKYIGMPMRAVVKKSDLVE